jgi:HptB-dependent secretion and biofilm anti anti-sigma factor
MSIGIATYGNEVNVSLGGAFGATDAGEFKQVMALTDDATLEAIFLDFEELLSIDDAGVGLLMMLRSRARNSQKRLAICRPHGEVEKLLIRSRLDILLQN